MSRWSGVHRILSLSLAIFMVIVAGCSSSKPSQNQSSTNQSSQAPTQSQTNQAAQNPAAQPAAAGGALKFPAGKQYKIGLASREIVNDANRDIIAGAKRVVEAAGGTLVVADGQTDPRKHNENVENLVNSGVDGLIISLGDAQQLAPVIAKAKAKNIPVVTNLVGSTPDGALTDVGGDEALMSALLARELLWSVGYKGDVYVFWVPGAPLLETRKRILEAVAKDYPQVKLHPVPTEHSPAKVQSQMEDILTANQQKGSIAAVWSAYDLLGSGAAEAIRKAGRSEIKMASIDGDRIGFQMLFQEGSPFISTVVMDIPFIGEASAQALVKALNGRAAEIPIATYTNAFVATRHNGIKAAEMRWGANIWKDIKMDPKAIEAKYPQTDDVIVMHPANP